MFHFSEGVGLGSGSGGECLGPVEVIGSILVIQLTASYRYKILKKKCTISQSQGRPSSGKRSFG